MCSEDQNKKNEPLEDSLLSLTEIIRSKILKLVVTFLKIFVNLMLSVRNKFCYLFGNTFCYLFGNTFCVIFLIKLLNKTNF